jgi:Icc-related predicted phosphoesterase
MRYRIASDIHSELWVHGHIHDRSAYTIGATRVICNPAGYDGRGHDPYLAVMSTGDAPDSCLT